MFILTYSKILISGRSTKPQPLGYQQSSKILMTTTLCGVISYQWFSDGRSADLIFLISYYSNQLILPSTPDIFLLLLNTNTTCNWFLSLNVSVHSYTGYSITSNCPAENINQSNRDTWDFMLKLLCRVNLLRRRNNPEYKSHHFSHKMSQIERMTFAAIRIIMQNQLIKWLKETLGDMR